MRQGPRVDEIYSESYFQRGTLKSYQGVTSETHVDSIEKKTLVEALISYGLNEYEAKAYLALLQFGPAVAGEISRRSGIPRPRVYDTLQRLIDVALVSESDGNPKSYAPLPLDDFLRNMAALFRRRQELLKNSLNTPRHDDTKAGVFHLFDEARIKERMQDLISEAAASLDISIPSQDLDDIKVALDRAATRGVELSGFLFGRPDSATFARLTSVSMDQCRTENGGRRFLLCRDGEELLVGHLGGTSRSHAITTRSRLLIEELTRSRGSRIAQDSSRLTHLAKS